MPSGVVPVLRRLLGTTPKARGGATAADYKQAFLRKIEIFQDLAPDDILLIERATRMTSVRKGQIIYHQEDTAEGLFLLKQGRVRLFRLSPGGKRLDLAVLEPGTFFGELPLLGERMRNASAEAIDDGVLCVMSQADIERLVLSTPQVGLRMLEALGRRLSASEARLEDLAYRGVSARLAAVLLRLTREEGTPVVGLTHQELGEMVGAYRETITKTLDVFRDAGYVELARRRIRIVDPQGLATVLNE